MSNLFVSQYEGLVEWVLVDLTKFGGPIFRFVNSSLDRTRSTPSADFFGSIDWQGATWTGLPFETASWRRGEQADKPKVVLPDLDGLFTETLDQFDNAPGAPVVRYQSIGLGMPFTPERYLLSNVQSVAGFKVTLQLSNVLDAAEVEIPSFVMTRKHYPGLGAALLR